MATVLHHLLRPARGGAAGVVIVFALLAMLAVNAGLVGIPLGLLLLSWFFKYAYILFDHVVRGYDEPPALDINMLNPVDEQRPLAQVLIVLVLGGAVTLAWDLSPAAGNGTALLALGVLPASIAVLGVERHLLKALYPPALGRMIAGLGVRYGAVLGVILGYAGALALLERLHLWLPIQTALGMFALLSIFSTLAGALYDRRHDLGLDTWHSPERTFAREQVIDTRANEALVTDAYGQVRIGAHVTAWKMLQEWLASRQHRSEDYVWLCQRVALWPDPRYATRLTEEFIDRLLLARRSGAALDVVAQRLAVDPRFRPKSAATTLQIARLAAGGGGAAGVARQLLSDFGERFPGHPLGESARELAAHLGK